jgi:hypothetical protein
MNRAANSSCGSFCASSILSEHQGSRRRRGSFPFLDTGRAKRETGFAPLGCAVGAWKRPEQTQIGLYLYPDNSDAGNRRCGIAFALGGDYNDLGFGRGGPQR